MICYNKSYVSVVSFSQNIPIFTVCTLLMICEMIQCLHEEMSSEVNVTM